MSNAPGTRILQVQHQSYDRAVVVTVAGEVDMASAPVLQSALDEARRDHPGVVVVDMSEVGFLGSAGLSVLLIACDASPVNSLRVVVSGAARRLIKIAAVDDVLDLFDTLEAALRAPELDATGQI